MIILNYCEFETLVISQTWREVTLMVNASVQPLHRTAKPPSISTAKYNVLPDLCKSFSFKRNIMLSTHLCHTRVGHRSGPSALIFLSVVICISQSIRQNSWAVAGQHGPVGGPRSDTGRVYHWWSCRCNSSYWNANADKTEVTVCRLANGDSVHRGLNCFIALLTNLSSSMLGLRVISKNVKPFPMF